LVGTIRDSDTAVLLLRYDNNKETPATTIRMQQISAAQSPALGPIGIGRLGFRPCPVADARRQCAWVCSLVGFDRIVVRSAVDRRRDPDVG